MYGIVVATLLPFSGQHSFSSPAISFCSRTSLTTSTRALRKKRGVCLQGPYQRWRPEMVSPSRPVGRYTLAPTGPTRQSSWRSVAARITQPVMRWTLDGWAKNEFNCTDQSGQLHPCHNPTFLFSDFPQLLINSSSSCSSCLSSSPPPPPPPPFPPPPPLHFPLTFRTHLMMTRSLW